MKVKKLLFVSLFLIIGLLFIPNAVNATEITVDGVIYILNEETKTASIKKIENNSNVNPDYEIKESVIVGTEKYIVTSLQSHFLSDVREIITKIKIPASVETIGEYAFFSCSNIESITLKEGTKLKTIEGYAFYSCSNLKSITIPASVVTIGSNAFYNCQLLENVIINKETSKLKLIGEHAFSRCTSLTSFTIPSSVTTIEDFAFSGSSKITSIEIPVLVETIGRDIFRNATALTNIKVDKENKNYSSDSDGVLFNKDKTIIVKYPEGRTTTLYQIPNSVREIEEGAFYDCGVLKNIIIPNGVTKIGTEAFFKCTFTSILLPETLTEIEPYAFRACQFLENVQIPSSVNTIGEYAFWGGYMLTDVFILNPEVAIEDNVFADCNTLLRICGFASSTAETHATSNNISFIEMHKVVNKLIDIENTGLNYAHTDLLGDYNTILKVKVGFELPTKIEIKIGDSTLDASKYSYNAKTGELKISAKNITENITIIGEGVSIYPAGTSSVEVIANNIIWVKEIVEGRTIWFGIDNSEGIFEVGSRFWVRIVEQEEVQNYYNKIDKDTSENINKDKLLIFQIGVTNLKGEEYTNLTQKVNVYVQQPTMWTNNIKAIYISEGKDENIPTKIVGLDYVDGRAPFSAFEINHLSPYAIYEEPYSYVFNANGGAFSNNQEIIKIEKVEDVIEENVEKPTKEGYEFVGYFTEKTGGTSLKKHIAEVGVDRHLTFYAQWKKIENDGDIDGSTVNGENDNSGSGDQTGGNSQSIGNQQSGSSPQTGDRILIFTGVFAISIVGIIAIVKFKKYIK